MTANSKYLVIRRITLLLDRALSRLSLARVQFRFIKNVTFQESQGADVELEPTLKIKYR
jgi:hypothetical protein